MSSHSYTKNEVDFLQKLQGTDTYKNITAKFNEKFGTEISKDAIRRKISRGFYVSHTPKYMKEQDTFLKEHSRLYSFRKVQSDFKSKFGFEPTTQAITDRCRRVYDLPPTSFSDKIDYHHTWSEKDVGTEVEKDNKIVVKTGKTSRKNRQNWKYKHHHIWEQQNGKVPKGYRVVFLDGNKRNFDIDNLACIPLKSICLFASNRWKFKNSELTKSAIKWCDLYYVLKKG